MAKRRPTVEQQAIREDVFRWLDEHLLSGAYEFSRAQLESYEYKGERIPLLDQNRGIRNPIDFDATLTVMTSAKKTQYSDEIRSDGLVRYSYRSGQGGDNVKLLRAFETEEPIVYFHGVRPGHYVAYYPAYIVHDDPESRHVYLALDETFRLFADPLDLKPTEKRYAERIVKTRLHQTVFRAIVLRAYSSACAICSIKHTELLDAAHIIADADADGSAHISNGIALCKIHHASFDRRLLGITPDYEVRIDQRLLDEVDGPMLRHGLQDMHGRKLYLPSKKADWPSSELLARKFEAFAA